MVVEPSGSHASVTGAIRQAARMTGADFQYLLATARVESNLDAGAGAATSSARGLFQFIEQTWLATLKERGPGLGYGPYANAIARLPSGEYAVADRRLHRAVMSLRGDPTANAVMAGAFTKLNAAKLAERLGHGPSEGELYIAHFLGAAGAGRLIELAGTSPRSPAAAAFPNAAQANPGIFYDRRGRARGAAEVYRTLVGRYDFARNDLARNDLARSGPAHAAARTAPGAQANPAAVTAAFAAAGDAMPPAPPARLGDSGPAFHGLFRTPTRPQAVAPVVSALWSAPQPVSASEPSVPTETGTPGEAGGGALDLFQERLPDARALFRGRV
jgi:hypothetical protein